MKKKLALLAASIALVASQPASALASDWSVFELSRLRSWMIAAPQDGLPQYPTKELDRAIASGNWVAINLTADLEALKLGRMHLEGCCSSTRRASWGIKNADEKYDLAGFLLHSLEKDDVDGFFAKLRPHHPEYAALRGAYSTEKDPARRAILARNMERWRWMPLNLGKNHLIVNIPHYRITYWQDGKRRGSWPVIVGKTRTPTPVFGAKVTGVIFNPWWNIPKSIVRESVGALVRRNPTEARRRGYVWSGGRYRQRPGPTNALGQMKLVMPNPYSVYIHDTPNKALFNEPVRALSHGCIRTGDALGFASDLLNRTKSRAEIDAIVARGETVTIPLQSALPTYIAYFTAAIGDDGKVTYFPDIYNRDNR